MGRSHNGAKVVRIFNTVEHDDQAGSREDVIERNILMRRAESEDALVRDAFRCAIESVARFEANRDGLLAAEFNNFLDARACGAFRDHDLVERTTGAERFPNRMDAKRETHVTFDRSGSSIVKRHAF